MLIEKEDSRALLLNLLNPEFKGAFISSEDHVAYWNKLGFPHRYYTICETKLKTINLCLYMKKNSCIKAELDRQILGFNANGLMKIWSYQYIDRAYLKERIIDPEPRQLQINQLFGGFQLYAGGIVIAFGVLILEFIINWLSKLYLKFSNRI